MHPPMPKPATPDQVAIVIPARMASTRLPGKPLKEFRGKPLLQWAVEAAQGAKRARFLLVASDSREIADWCEAREPETEWLVDETSKITTGTDRVADAIYAAQTEWLVDETSKIATGTDRVADAIYAAQDIDPILIDPSEEFNLADLKIVINLQCDEPEITAADLDRMIGFMQNHRAHQVVTFRCPWLEDTDATERRMGVKVIVDSNHNAIYFSRAEIPGDPHVGVYGFRMAALRQFALLPQSRLEICEDLEQLRLIEHGTPIHVLDLDRHVRSVNTPEDLGQRPLLPTP